MLVKTNDGKSVNKLSKTQIDLYATRLPPVLDEDLFKSHFKHIVHLGMSSDRETDDELALAFMREILQRILKNPTPLHKLILFEPHKLFLQRGNFPKALIERKRVLQVLFDHYQTNFNKEYDKAAQSIFADFLIPMLQRLELCPGILPIKDACVLYTRMTYPLFPDKKTPMNFDSVSFLCLLSVVSIIYRDGYCVKNTQSKDHALLQRIELSAGFKTVMAETHKCSLQIANPMNDLLEYDLPEAMIEVDALRTHFRKVHASPDRRIKRLVGDAQDLSFETFFRKMAKVAVDNYGNEGLNRNPLNAMCAFYEHQLRVFTDNGDESEEDKEDTPRMIWTKTNACERFLQIVRTDNSFGLAVSIKEAISILF